MSNDLTRRSFVKWGTAAAGAATLAGFTGCAPAKEELSSTEGKSTGAEPAQETGKWLTGACMNNCSCEHSRCLLRVYVEDGVPLRIRTDEEDEDSIEVPQRRACLRGRAQISNMTSPARIKYPMKRKGWSPGNPNGEMRGKDEWERISWDEALDYIAAEMQKAYDNYGPKSILCSAYSDIGEEYFDPIVCLLNAKGGAVHHDLGTVSLGSWPCVELFMTG
ncbi:MAG: molybdopterin-dependent oxidoreductase, partial [Adlercreutzia sp.]|nr:molybdopterin-dependent oxidoreductase [Adlercreutzia sp.]